MSFDASTLGAILAMIVAGVAVVLVELRLKERPWLARPLEAGVLTVLLVAGWVGWHGSISVPSRTTVDTETGARTASGRPSDSRSESTRSTGANPLASSPHARSESSPVRATRSDTFVNRSNFNADLPTVLVRDEHGIAEDLNTQLAALLGGTDGLFKPAFAISDRFVRAHAGDAAALSDLGLAGAASMIVIGVRSASFTTEEVAGHTIMKADASLSARIYRPSGSLGSSGFREQATGAAFTQDEALRSADKALAKQLASRLRDLR